MPKNKKKSNTRLTASQINTIAKMTAAGRTMRQIAAKIGVAPSSVWRHQQKL